MERLSDALATMEKRCEHLVCIDSDGTVFDNMGLKHNECFCPATINVWGLQGVARYAREAWIYVNLNSKSRGANRFAAVCACMELLAARPEVARRGVPLPDVSALRRWVDSAPALNPPALAEYARQHPQEPALATALRWSDEINENVARIVRNVPPVPGVREVLEALQGRADVVVVSDTPHAALSREWEEHGLSRYARVVCGQEFGGKQTCIRLVQQRGYAPGKVLMIGDAPRDHQAARACGVSFNPIVPNREEESWQELLTTGVERFLSGGFAGAYEDGLLESFDQSLAGAPPAGTRGARCCQKDPRNAVAPNRICS